VAVIGPSVAKVRQASQRIEEEKKKPIAPPKEEVRPSEDIWLDARTQEATSGPLRIQVTEAGIETVQLGDGGLSTTVDKFAVIRFTVRNVSPTAKVDYRGWLAADFPLFGDPGCATLSDGFGNSYSRSWRGNFTKPVSEDLQKKAIYPGESLTDLVIFQKPVDKAEMVRLELGLEQAGGKGRVRFLVPMPFVRRPRAD